MKSINSRLALSCIALLTAGGVLDIVRSQPAQVSAQTAPDPAWKTVFTKLIPSKDANPTWLDWCAITDTPSGYSTVSGQCSGSARRAAPPIARTTRHLATARVNSTSASDMNLSMMKNLVPVSELVTPPPHYEPPLAQAARQVTTHNPRVVSEVLFNPIAMDGLKKIAAPGKNISDGLTAYLGNHTNLDPSPFGPGSMIVKTIWGIASQSHPTTTMPLSNGLTVSDFDVIANDPHTDPAKNCVQHPVEPLGPQTSIGCFYHLLIQEPDIKRLGDVALKTYPVQSGIPPYYLVLLGFNVMVKNGATWDWYTFWWDASKMQGSGVGQGFSAVHTAGNPYPTGYWSYFAMDHITQGIAKPVFNPYLESFKSGAGPNTNCMTCHSNANYHNLGQDSVRCYFDQGSNPNFQVPQGSSGSQNPGPTCQPADNGVFTDFVWNLADSNNTLLHSQSSSAPQH